MQNIELDQSVGAVGAPGHMPILLCRWSADESVEREGGSVLAIALELGSAVLGLGVLGFG